MRRIYRHQPICSAHYFSGSLVARSQLNIKESQLEVVKEGTTQKFIPEVNNIDFNASYAKTLNQEVFIVTDRAVFELRDAGLTIIEIAPGLNLEKMYSIKWASNL